MLWEAILEGTDLEDAKLENSDLWNALMEGTNLKNAVLHNAQIASTTYLVEGSRVVVETDLTGTKGITQEQLNSMLGDTGTILPGYLTRPTHWPDWSNGLDEQHPSETPSPSDKLPNTLAKIAAPIEVYWSGGKLTTNLVLSAREPKPQSFHPPQPEAASMDLLASLGQMARQITRTLRTDDRINAAQFVGDLTGLFEAIAAEVDKPEGLVLSFVIDTNLQTIEALSATSGEALREVDGKLVEAFLALGQKWRDANDVLKEIDDPTGSEKVPTDRLEEIEAREEEMIGLLTDPAHADRISPELSGVTRDMAAYPWDKDDPEIHRLKRAAAFGALAHRIWMALSNPPKQLRETGSFYAALLAAAVAVIQLF